ncbi:aldehyde dehydrogenase family protein [Streptomyces sp. NPDC052721]|uniref:aldehyde dehydrogenase family protein n=1 Tax=Streptomyces sp. NPDC052721 TaxID=3154955 RepID=UPI0034425F6E
MPEPMTPYTGFDRMPLAGTWRSGGTGRVLTDSNPYSGEVLTEIGSAGTADVDLVYRAARDAQREWARTRPEQRAAVFERAADIIRRRAGELADWLTG